MEGDTLFAAARNYWTNYISGDKVRTIVESDGQGEGRSGTGNRDGYWGRLHLGECVVSLGCIVAAVRWLERRFVVPPSDGLQRFVARVADFLHVTFPLVGMTP